MYFPYEGGDRKFRGLPYQKYLAHKQGSNPWNQPYPPEKHLHLWAARVPISEIVEQIDVAHAFKSWLKGSDPRKGVLLKILRDAHIPFNHIGLGGSFSLGCQTTESDLDILIYGVRHIAPCLRVLRSALLSDDAQLMSSELASGYAQRYGKLYNLPFDHLFPLFARDLTKLYVEGYKISFIFTYNENEQHQIPKCLYQRPAIGEVTLRARIISSNFSWSFPRKYCLEAVDGTQYHLWSYHWLHKAMTNAGTIVEVNADKVSKKNLILVKLRHHIME
ncbi:MAG: hypothetical protein V1860_01865 [bacterium]